MWVDFSVVYMRSTLLAMIRRVTPCGGATTSTTTRTTYAFLARPQHAAWSSRGQSTAMSCSMAVSCSTAGCELRVGCLGAGQLCCDEQSGRLPAAVPPPSPPGGPCPFCMRMTGLVSCLDFDSAGCCPKCLTTGRLDWDATGLRRPLVLVRFFIILVLVIAVHSINHGWSTDK